MFIGILGKGARRLRAHEASKALAAEDVAASAAWWTRAVGGLAALLCVVGLEIGSASAAFAVDGCSNASLRTGVSEALPDCRAYELVSPDLNHAKLQTANGQAAADGEAVVYSSFDAPEHASSGRGASNLLRSRRDPKEGWSTESLEPTLPGPVERYLSFANNGVSSDFSSTIVLSTQALTPGTQPGFSLFVGRPDGTYRLLTPVASEDQPRFAAGNSDYSHVYFNPAVAQLPSDPVATFNTYSWTEDGGLSLVGILPDGSIAPHGARLAGSIIGPISSSGAKAVFVADDKLYLHTDGSPSIEVSASRRTINTDPNPGPGLVPYGSSPNDTAGVTAAGSTVLFLARSELTNDAYTGRSAGVATDAGADLYSYDTATGQLADLTVDTDPADVATGADVREVPGATSDGSSIYFTARGHLAEGASDGHTSLYVWHNGTISFVADADGLSTSWFYVTPDGQHALFASIDRLTDYDNRDPVTGLPHVEIYEATVGQRIECASCRSDGTRPTADTLLPTAGSGPISDDGRRVFFDSTDAILPQASTGRRAVYMYEDGRQWLISPAGGSEAMFVAAGASGDDAFFASADDLVPNPNGGDPVVFDARVGGGFPAVATDGCVGVSCRGATQPAPVLPLAASMTALNDGNVPVRSAATMKVTVSKVKTIAGTIGRLEVKVPGEGRLTVSGGGLQTERSMTTKAQTIAVRLVLTSRASKALKTKGRLKVEAKVVFVDDEGRASSVKVSANFKSAAAKRTRR